MELRHSQGERHLNSFPYRRLARSERQASGRNASLRQDDHRAPGGNLEGSCTGRARGGLAARGAMPGGCQDCYRHGSLQTGPQEKRAGDHGRRTPEYETRQNAGRAGRKAQQGRKRRDPARRLEQEEGAKAEDIAALACRHTWLAAGGLSPNPMAATTEIGQSAFLSRTAIWCTHFAEGVREGQEMASRYHALSHLSTPHLARRGLDRRAITRAALTGN